MTGIPARPVSSRKPETNPTFRAYGTAAENSVDSRELAIQGLLDEVQSLRSRLNALEGQLEGGDDQDAVGFVAAEDTPPSDKTKSC